MRNRLLLSGVLCALAVAGAGTPALVGGFGALADAQDRADRAASHQRALALAHSLADERDDMVAYVATGGDGAPSVSRSRRARVDRQIGEMLGADAVPSAVRGELEQVAETRKRAFARARDAQAGGARGALATHQSYTRALSSLQEVSRAAARDLPADGSGTGAAATAEALPALGRAVDQMSSARGLLLGALAAGGEQPQLTPAAQQARLRAEAALADFEQLAGTQARETYEETLTGAEITTAERDLARLTDAPTLTPADRAVSTTRVRAGLTAQVSAMRSVHSSLAAAEERRIVGLRDDAVTSLELRFALVAACLLVAVGAGVRTARSVTRPLAGLRRGAEALADAPVGAQADGSAPDPAGGSVGSSGSIGSGGARDDEFGAVAHALERLAQTVAGLRERAVGAETDSIELAGAKAELTAEHERLQAECEVLARSLEAASGVPGGAVAELGRRTLALVERQLRVVETLEAEEADPDRLGQLFALDHLATRIRRHAEGLLLFAGDAGGMDRDAGPVPLVDVMRAAVSEIEQYERVRLEPLEAPSRQPRTAPWVAPRVDGAAAEDIGHLVAELLDNAAAFSTPDTEVLLSARAVGGGAIAIAVEDRGSGMTGERLAELNAQLHVPDPGAPGVPGVPGSPGMGLGLELVARLASRHGVRVRLRERPRGGIAVEATLPRRLLPGPPVLPVLPEQEDGDGGRRSQPGGAGPGAGAGTGLRAGASAEGSDGGHGVAPDDAASLRAAVPDALPVRRRPADRGGPTVPAPRRPAAQGDPGPHQVPPAGPPVAASPAASDHGSAGTGSRTGTGGEAPGPELPRRVPGASASGAVTPAPRKGAIDADQLRRQLGGFQRGARDGHRDVAAEVAEMTGTVPETAAVGREEQSEDEEARS